ncbi:hypothetical protein [Acetivibrio cellulolyticus]|uniref:hypothetical protein n=1 Tax=Acetivibrio cellulolyticus TaxID=35830 RepID=UPI0001E2BE12|nr:hypothetical protein [Acetivibrio cellulolyticus]
MSNLFYVRNSAFDESVRLSIPIKMRNGKMNYLYGARMPEIRDGSICQLIISVEDIEDEALKNIHLIEEEHILVKKDLEVFVEINFNRVQKEDRESIEKIQYGVETRYGVKIILDEDLKILVKGDKNPVLLPCKCRIPKLDYYEADSINQAQTYIIQKLQEKRKSFTANAFQKTYVKREKGYVLLDDIRNEMLASIESRLIINTDEFILNEKISESILAESMKDEIQRKILSFMMINKNRITGYKIKELSDNKIGGVIELFDKGVLISTEQVLA